MERINLAAVAARESARESNGRFGNQQHSVPDTARDLGGLLEALQELDRELAREGFEDPIRVRAVGGFALLWHGLRQTDSYTVDIDSASDPYPYPVNEAIRQVGERLGLEPQWLNTDASGGSADEALELWDAAFVTDTDTGFALIDLQVADIPTLTRAKAIAVDTDAMSGRYRDWDDLLELLRRQGISSYREFCATYPQISEWEYPETHRSLESWFRTGTRGESESFDLDFEDFEF